jgi:hypothetical protein
LKVTGTILSGGQQCSTLNRFTAVVVVAEEDKTCWRSA